MTAILLGTALTLLALPLCFFGYAFARMLHDTGPDLDLYAIVRTFLLGTITVLLPGVLLLYFALRALTSGILDLLKGRRSVEGRVLHVEPYYKRLGSGTGLTMWWVIVDDGTTTELRPWAVLKEPTFAKGAVIRARISRHLAHVKDIEVLSPSRHNP